MLEFEAFCRATRVPLGKKALLLLVSNFDGPYLEWRDYAHPVDLRKESYVYLGTVLRKYYRAPLLTRPDVELQLYTTAVDISP